MERSLNQRILVVEDEPVIGNVCRKILSRKGFTVNIVSDGYKAIDNIDDHCYDLCILDMRMPGIDGIELYKYLADNRPELSQKIVFTTDDITSSRVSGFLNSSEKIYLEKPFTPGELVAAVEMAFN